MGPIMREAFPLYDVIMFMIITFMYEKRMLKGSVSLQQQASINFRWNLRY